MDNTDTLDEARINESIQRHTVRELLEFLKWLNRKPRSVLAIVNQLQDVLDEIRDENFRIGGKQ